MKVVRGNLHRLLYCSRVRLIGKSSIKEELPTILKIAQARNSAVDVTGALLVCNGWFVQELEGPMQPVLETYGRITRDPRPGIRRSSRTPANRPSRSPRRLADTAHR